MHSVPKRRRATAIVEYPDGILVTLMRYMAGSLPGGGIKPGEIYEAAVVRELHEETGLIASATIFLVRYASLAIMRSTGCRPRVFRRPAVRSIRSPTIATVQR